RCVGDDKGGLGAVSFDQLVDGDGRAVDQLGDGGWLEPALADAVDDALFQLRRGGQTLRLDEALGGIVEADQIGEGASDIDGDDDHAWRLQPLGALSKAVARMSAAKCGVTLMGQNPDVASLLLATRPPATKSVLCGIAALRRP